MGRRSGRVFFHFMVGWTRIVGLEILARRWDLGVELALRGETGRGLPDHESLFAPGNIPRVPWIFRNHPRAGVLLLLRSANGFVLALRAAYARVVGCMANHFSLVDKSSRRVRCWNWSDGPVLRREGMARGRIQVLAFCIAR